MSRDGSGNYSLPAGNPVGTGTTISSTVHNATMTDIASALTASIAKDGQTTPSANLPMGGYKHTAVANGTARDQYATVAQLQDYGAKLVGSVSGSDTITGTLTPAITSYATGLTVILPPAGTNTTAVTLALNGLAAKSIITSLGLTLYPGMLRVGNPAILVYNGTSFVLVSDNTATGTFTATLTGCTTSPTGTVAYTVKGNFVTLQFPDITGTSNASTFTLTGLPSALRPVTADLAASVPVVLDNSAAAYGVYASVSYTTGVITFYKNGSWTSSGTKGVNRFIMTYSLV